MCSSVEKKSLWLPLLLGTAQQTFYIGPTSDSISARHRLPISAQRRMCNSATHRADIGNRHRLPTCSRYCVDIHRSSLFLAKTRFCWLLKPRTNKIGKRKTGECINFNKFIYTNKLKATFEQFRRRRCTSLYSGRNRLKAASLLRGWLLWKAAYIFLTWGCYAAFEDIGTSSSDDVYSRAGSLDFFYISFDHLCKSQTKSI